MVRLASLLKSSFLFLCVFIHVIVVCVFLFLFSNKAFVFENTCFMSISKYQWMIAVHVLCKYFFLPWSSIRKIMFVCSVTVFES